MRIAYITYELLPDIPKGGIGTYTMQAAAAMHAAGHDVNIFAGSHTRTIEEVINGVKIFRVACKDPHHFTKMLVPVFMNAHNALSFDVAECPEIHGSGKLIKEQLPHLPLVVRLHGPNYVVESLKKTYTPFAVKARFKLGALRRGNFSAKWDSYIKTEDKDYDVVQAADFITAPSAAMKALAIKQWGLSPNKIKVLPNPFYAPAALLEMPIHKIPAKQILFFGRLNVLKGPVNFTKALQIFFKSNRDWNVKIIGDDAHGPYREKSMKAWMQKELHQYRHRISFHEGMEQHKLYNKIGEADIVVLPSLFETFSYACAEAMAAGKAIIGSSEGGMKDLLAGDAGIAVDVNKVKPIADALQLITENNDLRIRLSEHAKAIMSGKRYNEDVTKTMERMYIELIKRT